MICVCEWGGVQMYNCLQWGWGTGFAEILQNPSGSLDRISLPAAAADIVHVTALKEILSIPPSPAFFLLCIAWRFESLLSPFLFIKPTSFKCFSMFSFLYVFHTSLFFIFKKSWSQWGSTGPLCQTATINRFIHFCALIQSRSAEQIPQSHLLGLAMLLK